MQTFQSELTNLVCKKLENGDDGWMPGINTEEAILITGQEDAGTKCRIILMNNGQPWDVPENALLSLWYMGSSGEGNYTQIEGRNPFTVSGNSVEIELITQMLLCAGAGTLWLICSGTDGSRTTLCRLPYLTLPGPNSDSPAAQQYYTAFSEYVVRSEAAAKTAQTAANSVTARLNIETYTNLTALGISGAVTTAEVFAAMPAQSICTILNNKVAAINQLVDVPENYTIVTLVRNGVYGHASASKVNTTSPIFYEGSWHSTGGFSGWFSVALGGFGYGDKMASLDVQDNTFENKLDEILSVMASNSAKQLQLSDMAFYNGKFVGNLWKNTGSSAVLEATSNHGLKAVKCKVDGLWYPWEWDNPPMAMGTAYRTTQRWSDKPVYTMLADLGVVTADGTVTVSVPAIGNLIQSVPSVGGTVCNSWIENGEGNCFHFYAEKSGVDGIQCHISAGTQWQNQQIYAQFWYTAD